MSQFFKLHNIIFDMSLNIGINTTLTDLEPFSSGRIMKIIDPSGYGIVLPYLTNDISFVNLFIGSFTYKLNYDLYSAYTLQGFCDFNPYYIDNVGKEVDSNNNVYIYNPTRIDFSNNKISFCINSLNGDVVEKFVINSDGKVGIGKGDIIYDYEPTYQLDVNGSIDCQEFYLNGTLLNPAETHNLTSVTITNSNISYNINISKIETNNLTINNCLTIMQTLDISNYLDINGTFIGNAIYKYTDVSNETYKDSSDKMYIHDVDVSSVGLPKMTDETSVDVSSIYYNTSDYSIKNSTNTILNSSSSDVTTTPDLFNNSAPTGYLDDYGVKSITYDSNWWGFELQTTDNSMTCMCNMINSITDSGVNNTGSISVTVSENGSDVFDFYTESQVRTGFNIKKSGYYYATVVFPLNGSAYSDINFTFGFLKNTYSGTPKQNYLQTWSEFYQLSDVSPLDDNDSLNKFGVIKDTNYQIEGFSSDSPGATPLPGVITGRTVTQADSNASMNYSYEYSFPFVITTDGPHFVSFFATSDNNDYSIHNGLRIRFIKYGDLDESDFINTTYGSNTVDNQISTNQAGVVLPASTTISWLSNYATNGIPNNISADVQVATLTADTGDALGFTIVSYSGYYSNNNQDVDISYSPFYTSSNQLLTNGLSFPYQFSRYDMTDISFQITASNKNGSQPTPSSTIISINYPVPSETIITWEDSFGSGLIPVDTSPTITIGTLTSDTGDATGFTLIATTRGNELLEIVGSNLNLIGVIEQSDVGTLDFSINAINDTGTQVTATDFTIEFYGSLMNTYSVTGTYEENEYTGSDNYGIDISYVTVKFTDDGTITFDQDTTVDYLVVGGGGRSGWGSSGYMSSGDQFAGNGGGGGGGGVVIKTDQTLSLNTQYEVIVGSDEEDSSFNSTFAGGGGRGGIGTYQAVTGSAGSVGSEGAGSHGGGGGGGIYGYYRSAVGDYIANEGGAGATSPGYSGGDYFHTSGVWYFSGGGGGAGGSAEDSDRLAEEHDTAEGGPGVMSDITGTQIYYGAGGRGQLASNFGGNWALNGLLTRSNNFTDGAYGNGGDATNNSTVTSQIIDYGNDGVVIIRFLKYPQTLNTYSVTGSYQTNTYISDGKNYLSVKFTDDGTITFDQDTSVDYLVVGGGGAGGMGIGYHAGGGGGGGGVYSSTGTLTANTSYSIEVGDGGTLASSSLVSGDGNTARGEFGGDTIFNGITVLGGGGGGAEGQTNGSGNGQALDGGANGGGGAAYGSSGSIWLAPGASGTNSVYDSGTYSGGYSGGDGAMGYTNVGKGGGGGGAGGAGGEGLSGDNWIQGDGGDGIINTLWDGTDIYYGGGGGGMGQAGASATNTTSHSNYETTGQLVGKGGLGGGGNGLQNGADGHGGGGGGSSTYAYNNGTGVADSSNYANHPNDIEATGVSSGSSITIVGGNGGSGVVILRFLKYPES